MRWRNYKDSKGRLYGVCWDTPNGYMRVVKCNGVIRKDISKPDSCWMVVQDRLDKYAAKHGWEEI